MSGLFESSTVMGHNIWQDRVDEVLKEYRTAQDKGPLRDAVIKKLRALGVPEWAAVKWIDGKNA